MTLRRWCGCEREKSSRQQAQFPLWLTNRQGRRSRAGFSLVEALVTTVILGIGVVGTASTFTYAGISVKKQAYMSEARHVAEQAVEKVRAQGYDVFTQPSGSAALTMRGLPRATGTLSWLPYPDSGNDQGLRLLTVDLTWHWAGTTAGHYRVVTLVSKPVAG